MRSPLFPLPPEGTEFRNYLADRVEEEGSENAFMDCSRGDNEPTIEIGPFAARIDWMLLQQGDGLSVRCLPGTYAVHDGPGSDHEIVMTDMFVAGSAPTPAP